MLLRVLSMNRPWMMRSLVCGVTAACMSVPTGAGETRARNFVMRDGRKISLTPSTTEYGVTFRSLGDVPAGAARLRTIAGGKIQDHNGERNLRLKILRVPETNAATRALIASDPAVESVHAAYRFRNGKTPVIGTDTLLTRVKKSLTEAQREALWNDYGVTVAKVQPGQSDTYILKPTGEDEVLCAEKMAADPRTVWSQPNFRAPIEHRQILPSDEHFNLQWHLQNNVTPGADIKAIDAWVLGIGQDIIIGMFDDGCDVDHPDLRPGYIGKGHDPSFPSTSPGFKDPRPKQPFDNHGTRVMGLAVARANTIGGRGVAFQARFTASRGLSSNLSFAEIALAYLFARQEEVDVHINSWGFVVPMPVPAVIEDAIEISFTEGRNLGDLDGDDEDDPRGMVILFASGNDNVENITGFELSALPWVISVGASHDADARASYSNFGETLNFLAPSWANFRAGLFTTDNRDNAEIGDQGANIGGVNQENPFATETDKTGAYTEHFSGTSGACPIAAGVAALVLSVNPLLSADDVRIILEHTCDQIDPATADYHGITSRSLKYGYGRVNAHQAVLEAEKSKRFESDQSGTWPDQPADVSVAAIQLTWRQNTGTDEFLLVQSDEEFTFTPVDTMCYSKSQIGCSNAPLTSLPPGVSVLAVGCELACGIAPTSCELAAEHCVDFFLPAETKYFGIYARSITGRYSFGVAADSDGNVTDSGIITSDPLGGSPGGGTGGPPGGGGPIDGGPAVTIRAVPLEGDSPLAVQFQGNAVSSAPIDDSATAWDFETGDGIIVDSRNRTAVHTYTVPLGQTRTFEARLTMCDINEACDADSVFIRVRGAQSEGDGGADGTQTIRVKIGTLANPDANVTSGTSPVSVLLAIDSGSLQGTLESASWDLGDGARATSLSVPHEYLNVTDRNQRVVITANVTTRSEFGSLTTSKATQFLTIKPGDASTDPGPPNLPGAGTGGGGTPPTSPCGTTGMIPLLGLTVVLLSMMLMRKSHGA